MLARACYALILSLFFVAHSRADGTCVDPASLAHSAVGITRYFDDGERTGQPRMVGVQGTAWFLSPTVIVTAEHVAAGMRLSAQDWKTLEIQDGDVSWSIAARIQRLAGFQAEKLAVLELQTDVSGAKGVATRIEPLAPEERVVTLGYPRSRPRPVGGRFVQYGDSGRLAGTALFEVYEGNDRLAVDHGASGAPVFDCAGRVAAVISIAITQTIRMPSGEVRVSTAWGTPNVVAVPIQALKEFSEAK